MRFKQAALISLAFVFVLGCSGSRSRLKVGTSAEGEVVEAVGFAPSDGGKPLEVKKSSLTDAQRKAVEKVVGVFVSGTTMVEKAIAIEDNILSQTEGWIKKYDILKEWTEDGFYKTKIRALVAFRDLEAALKDLSLLNTPALQRPRVYVELAEFIQKKESTETAASRSLENALMKQGFSIVSADQKDDAEILIKGSVKAHPFQAEGLGGFLSYRSRLSAQAKLPGTNEVLVSYTKEASGLGGNKELAGLKSLEVVGDLAGEEIGEKITAEWSKGKNLIVFVEGAESFEQVNRVRKHLDAQPGVKDIVLRRFDEGLAEFHLQLGKLTPTDLASRLTSSKTLSFTVLQSSNRSLRLKLG